MPCFHRRSRARTRHCPTCSCSRWSRSRARLEGEWEEWLSFFLEGVALTADGAVASAGDLARLFEENRGRIKATGRRAGSALRLHEAFKARPLVTLTEVVSRSELSFPAASSAMAELVTMGIATELTGKKRNRVFAYERYLAILGAGT
jgi:Fic family protein